MRRPIQTIAVLTTLAGALCFLAPDVVQGIGADISRTICTAMPERCLQWRRSGLEESRTMLVEHRTRVSEGLRDLDEHAAQLRMRLDAVTVNSQLLAQREVQRRNSGAATLEFGGRAYTASDVEEQARLWSQEGVQFRTMLKDDVASRRQRFLVERERIVLTLARVEGVMRSMDADLVLNVVTRGIDHLRALGDAASAATRDAKAAIDPVRSITDLTRPPQSSGTVRAPFQMDEWLRDQVVPRS